MHPLLMHTLMLFIGLTYISIKPLFCIMLDGAIIEGPVTLEDRPVFVGSVTCTGSEQSFSECSHDRPPSGGCSVAAISCGMSSSSE